MLQMAKYYGVVSGGRSKSDATRVGTATEPIQTIAASWDGCVRTTVIDHGEDTARVLVELCEWSRNGAGAVIKVLYRGPINGEKVELFS